MQTDVGRTQGCSIHHASVASRGKNMPAVGLRRVRNNQPDLDNDRLCGPLCATGLVSPLKTASKLNTLPKAIPAATLTGEGGVNPYVALT